MGAITSDNTAIDVGGPRVYTRRQIAGLAFAAAGRPVRLMKIPLCTNGGLWSRDPSIDTLWSRGYRPGTCERFAKGGIHGRYESSRKP